MVSIIARLCALCAMCSLMQMAAPEEARDSLRLIGGLLMLHLVLSGANTLSGQAMDSGDLMQIFDILMK
ncbi:MAG: hypothetical protein IKK34_04275 [Clostridia bacterium]|nr:hypothetical protein [Clostridia bacterium]